MVDLIRAACLTHYADVARSVGIDPAKMLKSVGLPGRGLADPDIKIPSGGVRRLLEASAAAAGIDDFGLRLAERGGLSNLGPVALVVREQADRRRSDGGAEPATFMFTTSSIRLRIERHGDTRHHRADAVARPPGAGRQSAELLVGVTYRILSAFLGSGWRPLDVHFAYPAPRNRDDLSSLLQLQCRVRGRVRCDHLPCYRHGAFDGAAGIQRVDGAIRTELCRRPLQRAHRRARARYGNWSPLAADRPLFAGSRRPASRLRRAYGAAMARGARQELFGGPRCQRSEMVVRLIEDRNRSLPAVAELLGFSAQSALARWFRDRFGCSITQWRTDPKHRSVLEKAG